MLDVLTMKELWQKDVDGYLPVLMQIYNPDIVWSQSEKDTYNQVDSYLYLIADESKVNYKGHTYLPCAFNYTAPELDGKKVGNASLSISALDSRVKKLLRTIKLPSEVTIVSLFCKVEKEDASGIPSGKFVYKFSELNSRPFTMSSAGSNKTTATFNLVFKTITNQAVPFDVATADRTPGTKG